MTKKQAPTWADQETAVKLIASHLFNRPARAETINGVKCDCVLKLEADNWVIVETTEENTLEKLRTDLAKFAVVKPFLVSQNIYGKCFFITRDRPNPSLVETGNGLNVEVLSIREFSERLFNFTDYHYARSRRPFGSAVNPFSGDMDETRYTPVLYIGEDGTSYSLADLSDLLTNNKAIVLLGQYGTGKSRCVQEIFGRLSDSTETYIKYPIAINLKENWGLKRATEILTRHLSDLGLSGQIDSLMKLRDQPSICYLLDGFDEIGSQSWSDNPEKLKEVRRLSLLGVKDLVEQAKGGLIVVGREHYFNNNDEMLRCLGLDAKDVLIVRCKDEFSEDEMQMYLTGRIDSDKFPQWLPRRPLICQVINEISIGDIKSIFSSTQGEIDFWEVLIATICEREARIHGALDPAVIKNVLLRISRKSRSKPNNFGPISITEIYSSFEECTGSHTTDETAIMLQRLPGLGRIGPDSLDRQFVDDYILDGLRAEDFVNCMTAKEIAVFMEAWRNPLKDFGSQYVALKAAVAGNKQLFLSYLNKAKGGINAILIGDMVASLAKIEDVDFDFQHFNLVNTAITTLDLSICKLRNITISESIIEHLNIADSQADNCLFRNCIILSLTGVSSYSGLPNWIVGCEVESYYGMNTVSRIKAAQLNPAQLIFLSFVRKLFMQPGSGRKEAALLRGLGESVNRKLADRIIKIMVREDFLETAKGKEGILYIPKRENTKRLYTIMNQLSLSQDKVWQEITLLGR